MPTHTSGITPRVPPLALVSPTASATSAPAGGASTAGGTAGSAMADWLVLVPKERV